MGLTAEEFFRDGPVVTARRLLPTSAEHFARKAMHGLGTDPSGQ